MRQLILKNQILSTMLRFCWIAKFELIFNRFIRPSSGAAFDVGEVMVVVFVSADGGG